MIETLREGIQKVPLKVFIYGDNGLGKSSFADGFPNPVFLDTEGNIPPQITSPKPRIKTWQQAMDFVTDLNNGKYDKHGFKTLIVDSLDHLENYAIPLACNLAGVKSLSDQYWGALTDLKRLMEQFKKELEKTAEEKKMHVIFISHVKQKTHNEPGEPSYDQNIPTVNDRVAQLFMDWCNLVGYVHQPVQVERIVKGSFGQTQVTAKKRGYEDIVLEVEPSPSFKGTKNAFQLKTNNGKIPLDSAKLLAQVKAYYEQFNKQEKNNA